MIRNSVSIVSIVAAAVLALAACDSRETRTTVAKNDSRSVLDPASQQFADAGITASVNAELAKEPALMAYRIDVETSNGRVMLRGTAPDNAASDRATQRAAGVKGVTSVENRLEVRG